MKKRLISLLASVAILGNMVPSIAFAGTLNSDAQSYSSASDLSDKAANSEMVESQVSDSQIVSSSISSEEVSISSESVESTPESAEVGASSTVEDSNASVFSSIKDKLFLAFSDDRSAQANQETVEDSVFNLSATIDGQELYSGTNNDVEAVWESGTSKVLQITVSRNLNVTPDENKQYVLSISTPDLFYFNGIPNTDAITGAEKAVIIKNPTPMVYQSTKKSLPGFSPYSGEIRILLDPDTTTITIPDLGVSYNETLLGYTKEPQTLSDFLHIRLGSIDSTVELDKYSIDSLDIDDSIDVAAVTVNSVVAMTSATQHILYYDKQNQGITNGGLKISKYKTWSQGIRNTSQPYLVYRSLTIQYMCPYITINGKDYYLSFDPSCSELQQNKHLNLNGFHMSKPAVYDEENHTITYYFDNVYWGQWQTLFYTPVFSWPLEEEVKDYVIDNNVAIAIKGGSWKILEEKYYAGTDAILKDNNTIPSSNTVKYIPESVDITAVSSYEAPSALNISKMQIYKGVTADTGRIGTLGFFDIHNEGSSDSSLLNIAFSFNSSHEATAQYKVYRVVIPVYNMANGITVNYTLDNNSSTVTSSIQLPWSSGFYNLDANMLRSNSGVDSSYYIKGISYNTYLQGGTKCHSEAVHYGLYYASNSDAGRFAGFINGNTGDTASARLTISAADGLTSINKAGDTEITTTEQSAVGDDDSIPYGVTGMSINNNSSTSITAGNTAKICFAFTSDSNDRRLPNTNAVNGYYIFRDATYYVCLPKGIGFSSPDNISSYTSATKNTAKCTSVKKIGEEFNYKNTIAQWWEITVPAINAYGNETASLTAKVETDNYMSGIVWPFEYEMFVKSTTQKLSNQRSSVTCKLYDSVSSLKNSSYDSHKILGSYLEEQGYSTHLGLITYNGNNGSVKLNVVRNEARLDVATSLHLEDGVGQENIRMVNAPKDVYYDVTISNSNSGTANGFVYYIPIVKTDSSLDPVYLTSSNGFSLSLKDAASITVNGTEDSLYVQYTTDSNLSSANIQGSNVNWVSADAVTDYTKVTAVRIAAKDNEKIGEGADYNVSLKLAYDGSNPDILTMAGAKAAWKSFGHYSYVRNGAVTTNTYPSQVNTVSVGYQKSLVDTPVNIVMNAGNAASQTFGGKIDLPTTFNLPQDFRVKSVTPSAGLTLASDSPLCLSGSAADTTFRLSMDLNGGTSKILQPAGNVGVWPMTAGAPVTANFTAECSPNLTDANAERYVDITIGNADIDIAMRIRLTFMSTYTVTVPESVYMTAKAEGSGTYSVTVPVTVRGAIVDGQVVNVTVIPPIMTCAGSKDVKASLQGAPKTKWTPDDCKGNGTSYQYIMSAKLTPGDWSGVAQFQFDLQ